MMVLTPVTVFFLSPIFNLHPDLALTDLLNLVFIPIYGYVFDLVSHLPKGMFLTYRALGR